MSVQTHHVGHVLIGGPDLVLVALYLIFGGADIEPIPADLLFEHVQLFSLVLNLLLNEHERHFERVHVLALLLGSVFEAFDNGCMIIRLVDRGPMRLLRWSMWHGCCCTCCHCSISFTLLLSCFYKCID